MRKVTVLFLLAALGLFSLVSTSRAEDDFADTPLGRELVNLGMKFINNPGDFFFNLHTDNEDFSPLPKDERRSVRFNFFPTFLPCTWANLNAKVKLLNEQGARPQVDLVGMYGYLLAVQAMNSDVKPQFSDYSIGTVVSTTLDPQTSFFGGLKYSAVQMNVHFTDEIEVREGMTKIKDLSFKVDDFTLFSGLRFQSAPQQYLVAQAGYGFRYNKIVSRVMMTRRHLELGLDFFPDGVFVVHPFLAWHWYF